MLPSIPGTDIESGVIDLHNWGDGYGYDYIDLVGPGSSAANSNGVDQAIATFLITPTGTYDVSSWEDGGDYGDLAYQESQLFDLSNQLPDTAYGTQAFDFDPSSSVSSIDQFLANNVTVNGEPFNVSTNSLNDVVQANVIDNTEFNGLFNGLAQQQISLPSIAGTNIDSGVIDIDNLGNGFSYDYVDLNNTDIGAWLVTPTGTFDMSSLAGMASLLFDFPDSATATAPFDFLF